MGLNWDLYYDRFSIARTGDYVRWYDETGMHEGVIGRGMSANGGGNIKYSVGSQFVSVRQEDIYYIKTPDGHVFERVGDHWTTTEVPKDDPRVNYDDVSVPIPTKKR